MSASLAWRSDLLCNPQKSGLTAVGTAPSSGIVFMRVSRNTFLRPAIPKRLDGALRRASTARRNAGTGRADRIVTRLESEIRGSDPVHPGSSKPRGSDRTFARNGARPLLPDLLRDLRRSSVTQHRVLPRFFHATVR
jgi:hypothetical protein